MSHLTPDQREWFLAQEPSWLEQVDLSAQDFFLVYATAERRWQVRLGQRDGPELPVDPQFDVGKAGATSKTLRWRLVHLFMDRNEIPGVLHVLRQDGQPFETVTVRPR